LDVPVEPPRYGVVIRPDFTPEGIGPLARLAEQAGIDEVWLWEDCFLQGGIAQAAAALAATKTVRVGVGVMPAPLRSVVATAMEIATLDRMFPGRLTVAIGHGVQAWMRQAGVAVASPLTLLGEYVGALRDLLSGSSVTSAGRYVRLTEVQLQWLPSRKIPILIGGAGAKTLRLARQVADGVVLDCQHTPTTARAALDETGYPQDDARDGFSSALYLACAPGEGGKMTLRTEADKWNVASANEFGVGGDIDDIRDGIRPYLDAGVKTLVLQSVGGEEDMPDFIRSVSDAIIG